jgi:hypothetical protein
MMMERGLVHLDDILVQELSPFPSTQSFSFALWSVLFLFTVAFIAA